MPMFMQKIVSVDEVLKTWTIMQDFVLIEDFGTPEYEVGSLISIAGMKSMPKIRYGKVLKVGPGQRKWSKALKREIVLPLEVKPGDMVAYFKHHGTHTTYRTEDGLVLRLLDHRSQILAVIAEPPNEVASMAEWEAHLRKNAHFEMQI
jgi:co-chaperonin GroES (HSP10)